MDHWLAALLAYLSRIPAIAASDINSRIHRVLLLKEVSRLISSRASCFNNRTCRCTSLHSVLFSLRFMSLIRPTYSFSSSFCPSSWWISHPTTGGVRCVRSVAVFLLGKRRALIYAFSFGGAGPSILHSLGHGVNKSEWLLLFIRLHPRILNNIGLKLLCLQLMSLGHILFLLLSHLFLHIF